MVVMLARRVSIVLLAAAIAVALVPGLSIAACALVLVTLASGSLLPHVAGTPLASPCRAGSIALRAVRPLRAPPTRAA